MKNLTRIAYFMRPYPWAIVFGVITVVLPVTMELLVPRALGFVIDEGIRRSDMQAIWQGSAVMLAAAFVGAIATLGQGLCRAQLSQGIAYDMRNALFTHIQAFSFANLDRLQTGQLMTRVSSDVDVVRMFSSAGLALLMRALLMIFGSVILLLLLDWKLTIIVLITLSIAAVIIWATMRMARPIFSVVQRKLSALNTIVQENLAGIRVVRAYAREAFEIGRFGDSNVEYMDENIKVGSIMAVVTPALLVITNVASAAIIWFGGLDVIGGGMTVGELVAFNSYLMIGMAPLLLLGNILMMVSRADASAERVQEVLNTQPAIHVSPSARSDERVLGQVIFEDVTFGYDAPQNGAGQRDDYGTKNGDAPRVGTRHEDVLKGVDFSVRSGQRVALLGATGAGKSTLVNLIPRFYDAAGGRICIDGVDVRDWDPHALRAQVGMVLQQTTLFTGTIRENIAYGRPDASSEEVVAAAQAAQAHDFITAMPDGYESPVGGRGMNLSGGQRQRIAIARALLVEPGILILDDSTSSVDLDTEVRIQDALEELMAKSTTFIVAQRINSVLNADQILVLDDGRIVDRGTHAELLQSSEIYQEIYRSQIGEG